MFSIIICMILSTFSGVDSATSSEPAPPYDVSRTIGGSACFEYLHTEGENYAGFCLAGFFRPIIFTELGLGFSQLSGNDNKYSYVSSYIGFYSPTLWRIQFTGGAAVDIGLNIYSESGYYEVPSLLIGGTSWYTGLDMSIKDIPDGFQYNLRTRVRFKDYSLGRISVGCYLLN